MRRLLRIFLHSNMREFLERNEGYDPEMAKPRIPIRFLAVLFTITAFVLVVLHSYLTGIRPPSDFPVDTVFTVPRGTSLATVASRLEEQKIIRSAFWLKSVVVLLGGAEKVHAGDYFFTEKEGVISVAKRIIEGDNRLVAFKVTIPEGSTVDEISRIFGKQFGRFDAKEFRRLAKGKEGYLFPDTYFFLPNVTAEQVLDMLESTFEERIATLEHEITLFKRPLKDVIIMASLLEEEARTTQTRRAISGILWERLRIGMALQVDAVFPYINGKNTYDLTMDDLAIDSPYNTYRYAGLPPGPISNPGLDSIRAAVTPIASPYLYYLSDREGNIYYSRTFEEHVEKKFKYIH